MLHEHSSHDQTSFERSASAQATLDWQRVHEELSRLAKCRARLDWEESRLLLDALRSGAHLHLGFGGFGEYVERILGYTRRATEERLRVAEALESLPELGQALREGSLCWSAARELTRVATADNERVARSRARTHAATNRGVRGGTQAGRQVQRNRGTQSTPSTVRGWILGGDDVSDYAIVADTSTKHTGHVSGSLRAVASRPRGFGTLMQSFKQDAYLGKRLRLSAFIKTDNVIGWAGLWMRVDGPSERRSTAFDNMQDRPIVGTTDWTRYDVVLDVASDTSNIAFGVLLNGAGQVWLDDVRFEIVKSSVPTTGSAKQRATPENLDFEL